MISYKYVIQKVRTNKQNANLEKHLNNLNNINVSLIDYELEKLSIEMLSYINLDPLKNFKNNIYDLRKNELYNLLYSKIEEILLKDKRLEKETILDYIKEVLHPYYKNRFRRSFSREISFLPLNLRLYLYYNLLKLEDDVETKWHLMDRIQITLAKMGQKQLSQLPILLNALINIENGRTYENDYIASHDFIKTAKENREAIVRKHGFKPNDIIDELRLTISNFIAVNNIHDRVVAMYILDILKYYYHDIPDIDKHIENLKNYIKTEDINLIQDIATLGRKIDINYTAYVNNNNKIEAKNDELISKINEQLLKQYVAYNSFKIFRAKEIKDIEHVKLIMCQLKNYAKNYVDIYPPGSDEYEVGCEIIQEQFLEIDEFLESEKLLNNDFEKVDYNSYNEKEFSIAMFNFGQRLYNTYWAYIDNRISLDELIKLLCKADSEKK
ncbi:MAG: hypothetical protein JG776_1303 [Caloramator sp.]|jgi:hypothetical protein|uniref:hypothetical protein n=1 Tax=Caloramator sp. TaxID=1871330 RepID=UPI001D5136E2|nr:hypothetical protein [Caloramator sp.]MBZ4663588.1 hypothetical protein [Caloramator sp.]